MNEPSETSSEDYEQIVATFLDVQNFKVHYYQEWQKIPEIAYLTIKALAQRIDSVEQKVAKNSQLITEQAIKVREVDLEIQQHCDRQQSDRSRKISSIPNNGPSPNPKRDAFQKKAINAQNSLTKLQEKNSSRQSRVKGHETHRNVSNSLNHPMHNDRLDGTEQRYGGLDQTMIQEVKTLAETLYEHRVQTLSSQLYKSQQKLENKLIGQIGSLEQNLHHATQSMKIEYKQLTNNIITKKDLIETQSKLAIKAKSEQDWLYRFIDENFITQKHIDLKMKEVMESIATKEAVRKSKEKSQQHNQKKNKSERTANHPVTNQIASSSLHKVKFDLMKELSLCVKSSQFESIISEFQQNISKLVNSNKFSITQLQQKVSGIETSYYQLVDQYEGSGKLNKPDFKKKEKGAQNVSPFGAIKTQKSMSVISTTKNSPATDHHHKEHGPDRQDGQFGIGKSIQRSLQSIEKVFGQKLQACKTQLTKQTRKEIKASEQNLLSDLEEREKHLCELIQENCGGNDCHPQKQMAELNHQFVASTKQVLKQLAEQLLIARYLHYGENECKDLIDWEQEACNSAQENYLWDSGKSTVTVVSSGLYKVEAGIYDSSVETSKHQYYLLLNGEPIASFQNKQIPVENGEQAVKARGNIICEPILLPAHSKLAIRVNSVFYGQAFLQIQKL